jgi:drug/metabolite transporter (DMT)-like permease
MLAGGVSRVDLLLAAVNGLYGTSYVVTRLTLDDVPPALLALIRLVVGGAILWLLVRRAPGGAGVRRRDEAGLFCMGALGFAAAFASGHWGITRSTATNAALLIVVEPLTLLLLGPLLLGERLTRREWSGAALGVGGAVIVVVNGIPGVTLHLVPHWRGDLLLVLSGVAYASYSLIGRGVLARVSPLVATTRSLGWGALVMVPLVAVEWLAGARPAATPAALGGTVYLAVAITALGYLAWNHALARVPASRVAIFLPIQPLVGAVLGVLVLREPPTVFTVAGGLAIAAGLCMTVRTES